MRILIISTFFPPLNSIASLRPYSFAKYWTLEGHDVTVITTEKIQNPEVLLYLPNPGYKLIEIPTPKVIKRLKNSYIQKKKIPSTPQGFFHSLREKRGILNACRFPDLTDLWAIKAYYALTKMPPWDLTLSTFGPYSPHIIANKLRKKGLAKRWVADYRDKWSNNHIFNGIFPFNALEKVVEKKMIKTADIVTTVSQAFSKDLETYLKKEKVYVIENGFDKEDLEHLPKERIFFQDGKYRLLYTGTLYPGKQDPTPLFEAINGLSKNRETKGLLDKLEVIFSGVESAFLQDLIKKTEVGQWVRSVGFVKRQDALRMQRDAHALLFFPWQDPSHDGVLTGKLFEYLYSETPIVAIGKHVEASANFITSAKAGQILTSVDAIRQYLVKHLKEGIKNKPPVLNAVLKRYTRRALAKKMLEIAKNG